MPSVAMTRRSRCCVSRSRARVPDCCPSTSHVRAGSSWATAPACCSACSWRARPCPRASIGDAGSSAVIVAALVAGLAILDTALVTVSRCRVRSAASKRGARSLDAPARPPLRRGPARAGLACGRPAAAERRGGRQCSGRRVMGDRRRNPCSRRRNLRGITSRNAEVVRCGARCASKRAIVRRE